MPTLSQPSRSEPSLDELRREIDAIDAQMHAALIRRGEIIERLVAAKTAREGGAFRPDREADMMRRIVERHDGRLPLTTVEHLWREIISTFTQLQAGYKVHLDAESDLLGMADTARFYFGFATPVAPARDAASAVAAVAGSRCDLALVRLAPDGRVWWDRLGEGAQVMARLPFIRLAGREAATPALVVSRPLTTLRAYDVMMLAVDGDAETVGAAVATAGAEITCRESGGARRLVAVHASAAARLKGALDGCGAACRPVGGYFAPIEADGRGA